MIHKKTEIQLDKIKLFNSLMSKKEEFIPFDDKCVKIYACGPTIYKSPHVGNFRSFIIFDVLFRFMQQIYPKVIYVRNLTDIDDKIISESKLRNIPHKSLTNEVHESFKFDSEKLNVLNPTYEPKATEYIHNMIQDIEKLIENGFAYVADGNVLFDSTKYDDYRAFCKNMNSESGARIELTSIKKHENDFVLWKPSNDVFWSSPWGNGRPGWHIECTSMSKEILGFPFDIHCGGQDLIFPHHTNERAQGYGLCNVDCAKYWIHNHFVNIDNNKMSKSSSNALDLKKLLEKYNPMVIRLFLLMSHYRHPMNWSEDGLEEAGNIYAKWKRSLSEIEIGNTILSSVYNALADDINTPLAIKKISEIIKNNEDLGSAKKSCEILGIHFNDAGSIDNDLIEGLVQKREEARKNKDYNLSDQIRDQLKQMGIIIEDSKDGIKWRKE
ncbi:cysteine--tRNA ligase [Candidatus Cytomitobacter indipagum]|uniref:Cysteine--tRNA ligase n=1 Tax=Candidatus Cytomitobacter indipagum TaxID=2601575 RepID=A0A5C0UDP9_9PROT|nr:cysteine--tRNA ligase [Candidatus Cytomitobacter indipagum]QEK37887.1 cysteine--tRNA ligase [Candidatus Cytomitobacter indipagum]